ncbi:MAG: DUF2452 domain-containing protein, partial [Desulfofustis sp.]
DCVHTFKPSTGRPDYMSMAAKYKGENVRQPHYLSPYPVCRLVPGLELVELAKASGGADDVLTRQATAQLRLVAEQIEQLRDRAKNILAQTRENQELHRALCRFSKRRDSLTIFIKKGRRPRFLNAWAT